MPIETPHPLYSDMIDRWQRCRDAYDGEDAVKEAGKKYLPPVDPSQTGSEYEAYKTRALYYEAVSRTVDGFIGAISRKPHVIELPPALIDLETDTTADGTAIGDFIKKLALETLLMARAGILVDYDEAKNRAYLSVYQAESIISWSDEGVILRETVYEPDPDDAFKQVAINQIRDVHIEDGAYTVSLYREKGGAVGADWLLFSETVPTIRGAKMGDLPWFWLSSMGRASRIEKPPLLGLVNVALSHYRSSADLEHGRHFTALPTLYVTGATSDEPIRVGAASAIVLQDAQAKVGYAEFSGQGLKSLETALDAKEHQMATLGAAIWGGKKGVEAAETARIRTAGENSLLMSIVSSIEEVLTTAIEFSAKWMGVSGPITIQINRDFIDQTLDAQTLIGMVQAVQAGAMTVESFLYSLQQADMLPPDTEIEEEAAKLKAAADAKTAAAAKVAAQVAQNAPAASEQPPEGKNEP